MERKVASFDGDHFQGQLDTLHGLVSRGTSSSGNNEGRVDVLSVPFNDITDVQQYLKNNKVENVGIFWDLFSVLVAMKPKSHSGKDWADEVHSSMRTSTTNHLNDLCASMTHPRPHLLFGKANGELCRFDKGFGCPNYLSWVGKGTDSHKLQLTNYLKDFLEGVKGAMWGSSQGNVLANEMLNAVKGQWNDLITFIESFYSDLTIIESFYSDLTTIANFPAQQAWELVGRSVGAFFETMRLVRRRASRIQDANTLKSKALLMWTVLQCHRQAAQFISLDFRGHPSIVKEMSLFMLTQRVNPSELTLLEDKVGKLGTALQKQNGEVTKLDSGQAALKRTVDNLSNSLNQVKSKVK